METPEQSTNPVTNPEPPKNVEGGGFKKGRLIWIGVVGLLLVALFFWHPFTSTPNFPAPEKKEPAFKRDEPTKPQIFQPDYEEKIKDMINAGKTVAEISKETGVSRKEIRRIKKEMGKPDMGD